MGLQIAPAVIGPVYCDQRPPLPRGFMRLLERDGCESDIPCLADVHLPSHSLWHLDLYNDGRVAVAAHPAAWAEVGARNFAAAFRPQGVR